LKNYPLIGGVSHLIQKNKAD